MATSTQNSFRVSTPTQITTADPQDDNFIKDLTLGLQGGENTYDFFSGNLQALEQLYNTVATGGDSVWIDGVDEKTGMPITYVSNGSNFLTLSIDIPESAHATLQNGTGSMTTYKQAGIAGVTLTTNQGTSQMMVNDIQYAGFGFAGIALLPLFGNIAKKLIRKLKSWVQTLFEKVFKKGAVALEADEGTALLEGSIQETDAQITELAVEIAEEVTADVIFTTLATVGTVIAVGTIAVVLLIKLLTKQMYSYVKFYNATSIPVNFGIGYVKSGSGAQQAPADVGSTSELPAIGAPKTPPGVISSELVITRSDVTFINTNLLYGIGFVLMADASGSFPGFRVMVDIPANGTNSLWVGFGTPDSESIWNTKKNTNIGLTTLARSGNFELQLATNQTYGQSPSPTDATKGYNYEHLLVLTDGTVNIGQPWPT